MKKGLLLTCLLTLVAVYGMAIRAQWPIVLTTADGLPGIKVVRNYTYQSAVYELEEAVSTLRFTVCSTNTIDALTEGSFDGYSSGWGTGFPFFTISEFRIYDGEGNKLDYIASGNAVAPNDGGGLAALNDDNEGTYLHTVYLRGTLPHAYHYLEFQLPEPVKSFSFNWNARSNYHKNLITYVGITPGTEFFPFPEQEFQLGEQVTSVDELAEEGALFVLRSNGDDSYIYPDFERTEPVNGQIYMHSPCGGAETASSASLIYLVNDPAVEDGYKVRWLNNGHYILKTSADANTWLHWTNDELRAGTVTFLPCDTAPGTFALTMNEEASLISYDFLGKMAIVPNNDEAKAKRSRPNCYNWTIYNASINGAAIAQELQAAIDEAQARLDAVGGKPVLEEGEYDALLAALAEAREMVADSEVTAAQIITKKRELNMLTAAYVAVGIWAYIDSIDYICQEVENGDILVSSAPDWVYGSYNEEAYRKLSDVTEEAMIVTDTYQSLAEIDVAISYIITAIDAFWASKITGVKTLPFRVGAAEDGLPGVNQNSVWIWESPTYLLAEEIDAIRITTFKNHSGRNYNGFPYLCINEMEFYDVAGRKIELTEDCFSTNSLRLNDGAGLAGLCDGNPNTDQSTHFHSVWGDTGVDLNPENYTGTEYVWIEILFPEPISGFKYKQYGRGNGYDDVPTDFVFGWASTSYLPDDVDLPDPANTTLGEKITDVSQIGDEGFYALAGLINCAPEGDGTGFEKFYTSNKVYGKKVAAPCVFSIRKTGDEDGSFYIQTIADASYWSAEIDDDGWGAGTVTSLKSKAGKFIIAPANREEYGQKEFPNTFVIYQYNDTVKRNEVAHPYIVVQDWGGNTGYFSIPTLEDNDWDGEGEWYIYKVTMDNAYVYWLKNLITVAEGLGLEYSVDPGYYQDLGTFPETLAAAQAAVDVNDNAACKSLVLALDAAIDGVKDAVPNPMTEGIYVIESANPNFYAIQGVKKLMCTYYNDFEETGPDSEYSLWWGDAPAGDYKTIPNRYKFAFISAKESEKVQLWLEDSIITPEQAANAYYIKSIETNQYAGTSINGGRAYDIGLTDEAEEPYIVRSQGAYKFDLWHPSHANNSMHLEGNSGGSGDGGDIVYWSSTDASSQWRLRRVDYTPTPVKSYTVEVFSNGNGTVSGGGEYLSGTQATLVATPDDGYMFAGWYSGDKLVSSNSVYKFVVVNSQSITARFILLANTVNLGGTIEAVPGKEVTIPVNLTNSDAITAFQFDLNLPSGVTLKSVSLASGRKTSSHSLSYSKLSNGKTRVVAYSGSNKPFVGNNGIIANITVKVSDTASLGQYSVSADNIRLIKPDATEILLNSVATKLIVNMMYGDANKDNQVTLDDVVVTVNYILERNPSNFWFAAADVNKNSEITMSDAVSIVNIILSSYLSENSFNAIRNFVTPTSDAILSMQDAQGNDGSVTVPVSLSNSEAYTAFQMDVELPEDTEFASARLSSRAALNHTLAWNQIAANKVRVVAYSIDNSNFSDNSGDIIFFDITSEKSVNGAVSVDNVRMITDEGVGSVINGCGSLIDINGTTGIGDTDSDALSVYGTDGAAIIESGKAFTASVYTAGGRLVQTVDVAEGKNRIALPAGTYIVAGVKVIVK